MKLALLHSGTFLKRLNEAVSHSAKCWLCCYRTLSYKPNMSEASAHKWQTGRAELTRHEMK